MASTESDPAIHFDLLSELQQLEARAEALSGLGAKVEKRLVHEDGAQLEYKALKEHLAARLKDFERRRPAEVADWVASTFTAALRKAHIEMRPPTNASAKTQTWHNAVNGAREELNWHAITLANGLAC